MGAKDTVTLSRMKTELQVSMAKDKDNQTNKNGGQQDLTDDVCGKVTNVNR